MYFNSLSIDLYRSLFVDKDFLLGFYVKNNKLYGRFFDGKGVYKKLIAIKEN